jgi:NADPH-dependent curcumin reductase CurA
MVDATQLFEINRLLNEFDLIGHAIELLNADGQIIAMTIAKEGDAVGIQTDYIAYPAQMKNAIITAITARRQQLQQELSNLGMTGLEARKLAKLTMPMRPQ